MSDELEAKEMILEYTKVIAKQSYDDLLHHSFQSLGEIGANIVKTVLIPLTPFYFGGNSFKRLKRYFSKLGDKVPQSNLQEPSMQFIGKGFESLKWIDEGSRLEEMYLDLLAASMDKERDYSAHPAFFEILNKLSPDEAVILSFMKSNPVYECSIRVNRTVSGEAPSWISKKIKTINLPLDDLLYPENYFIYISNPSLYNLVELTFPKNPTIILDQDENTVTSENRWNYFLSDFGKLFISACLP